MIKIVEFPERQNGIAGALYFRESTTCKFEVIDRILDTLVNKNTDYVLNDSANNEITCTIKSYDTLESIKNTLDCMGIKYKFEGALKMLDKG